MHIYTRTITQYTNDPFWMYPRILDIIEEHRWNIERIPQAESFLRIRGTGIEVTYELTLSIRGTHATNTMER